MRLELHYFGWIAEKTGRSNEELELEEASTVAELRQELIKKHPDLEGMSFRIARDRQLVRNEKSTGLGADMEVALLPAFAGG